MNARRIALVASVAATALSASACLAPQPIVTVSPELDWSQSQTLASQAVVGGRYAEADTILARFAGRHPQSYESLEAEYWRALFLLDPGNPNASRDTAIVLLDQYAAADPNLPHWREAVTLRRVAAQLKTAEKLASAAVTTETGQSGARTVVVEAKDRDAEVARLKSELAKANKELERIKRRLTTPPPQKN